MLRAWAGLLCLIVLSWTALPVGIGFAEEAGRAATTAPSLAGQFLVASPKMPDPRFARTVIYMISHDGDGAMGLVINRGLGRGPLRTLLEGFGVERAPTERTVTLHYGGPVEQARGFVLHSADYDGPSTRIVDGGVAVSVGIDVLKALANGGGPDRSIFLLGYAGWGPGQLEGELARNDWLTAPADDRLIFADDLDSVWEAAMRQAGTPL
jgi:putative transcriptional regulator